MSCRGPGCTSSYPTNFVSNPTLPAAQAPVAAQSVNRVGLCAPSELIVDLVVAYTKLVNAVRASASSDLTATMQLTSCGGLVNTGCLPGTCTGGNPFVYSILSKALRDIAAIPLCDLQRRLQIACCAVCALVKALTIAQFQTVVYGLLGCSGPLSSYLIPGQDAFAAALCSLMPYFYNLSPTMLTCVNGTAGSCTGQRGAAALFKIDARAAFPCQLLQECCIDGSGASFIPPGPVMTSFEIILNLYNSALDCRMTGLTVDVNHANVVAQTRGNFPMVQLAECTLQYPYNSE